MSFKIEIQKEIDYGPDVKAYRVGLKKALEIFSREERAAQDKLNISLLTDLQEIDDIVCLSMKKYDGVDIARVPKEYHGYRKLLGKVDTMLCKYEHAKPVDDRGLIAELREAIKERVDFEIGLYEDGVSPVKALIMELPNRNGFRLTNQKVTGRWILKRKFKCSAAIDDMFPKLLSSHPAPATESLAIDKDKDK